MKHKILSTLLVITLTFFNQIVNAQQAKKPKLIVGIVIDQMRSEYLYRFQDNYTENGFKRLLREGFNVKNTHYNYVPTATGPGHTSVYTGTTPTNHGIVSNDWYSRALNRTMYCVEDSTKFLVDSDGIKTDLKFKSYFRSPKNIKTTTITDELKLFTKGRSKVIGISLKDRGAICPAGHLANAAYWYNSNNGHFITSSYYTEKLPNWLVDFNNAKKADSLLNLSWKPLLPIENYKNSNPDNDTFEKVFKGKENSTFPYNLKKLKSNNGGYGLLTEVPYGNTILTQLAKTIIKEEQLGKTNETDFITISYSSTDYVGHNFGIRSKELEDTYVRLDREIALLLDTLDKEVGKGNYTLFLTADHAGSDNPVFLESKRLPGKFYNSKQIKDSLNAYLSKEFGEANYIAYMDKTQAYISKTKTPKEEVIKKAISYLKNVEGVKEVFAPGLNEWNVKNSTIGYFIANSYNPEESGDIYYHMYSGWMEQRTYGTTHGTTYTSDTHVPLLWFGAKVPKGESVKQHSITQIAPTISMMLDIPLPNASDRNTIEELFE
ncbi:alkaline phosphatase PafA [Snuella lapsa]|uniref:Alkaline phosphatase family protein n=1 Tax=Snuella lapsa TaxID=870481 RepID=A0ABP6YE22_9FLAO